MITSPTSVQPGAPARTRELVAILPTLFGATLLLSAFLLFCIEPMIAKMMLPLLGGGPAVWNTCLVFFQAALLLGYIFSLLAATQLSRRQHALAQAALIAAPLLVLPIAIAQPLAQRFAGLGSVAQALCILCAAAGLPFLALSTVAPTLQRWYANTGAPGARDPYFLYAASNLGSLSGLLAYPLVIEPRLGLHAQASFLRIGYALVVLLVCACALSTLLVTSEPRASSLLSHDVQLTGASGSKSRQRARWLLLALVPSAYLVAVTSHLVTDITPAPLLWVIPLAVYLLSFVVTFAARPPLAHVYVVRFCPIPAVVIVYLIATGTSSPLRVMIFAHVLAFFAACLLCHGELAAARPNAGRLNEFYVWTSLGGLLGGVVVALVAPLLFSYAIEYPICVILALLARPGAANSWRGNQHRGQALRHDLSMPLLLLAFIALSALLLWHLRVPLAAPAALLPVVPILFAYRARSRPLCFAACGAAVMLGMAVLNASVSGQVLLRARNFFGIVQVRRDAAAQLTQILHGNTLHGAQSLRPGERREPGTYYARRGPVGDVFELFDKHPELPARIAVIGLGAGTLAAYARPQQSWTFFEINPVVVKIATDPTLFTYLADAPLSVGSLRIVEGDARLELRAEVGDYGLLLVDAFSSDAIPVHLLTEQALREYGEKMALSGFIAWHISNRHVDLRPVLAAAAAAQGWVGVVRQDFPSPSSNAAARSASCWVLMSKSRESLAGLPQAWQPLAGRPAFRSWTDDRSSIASVLSW